MNKFRHIFSILSVSVATLLLSGCKLTLLDPKGMIAAQEKTLLIEATVLMLLIVVPVILLTLWISWHYRASNTKATYTPQWSHSTKLEIVCWGIPSIIIFILAIMTWRSSHQLDPYRPLDKPGKPLVIQAISLEWKWLFIYPDQGIATINYVQIPAHVPVRFMITSDAPMNSFAIPRLAGQIYSMGGMRTKLNLIADEEGTYRGLSTNYSGDGFSNMNFVVKAGSQQDFDTWVQTVKQAPQQLTIPAYSKLLTPTDNNKVTYYSTVADNLFEKVIMKFMSPTAELAKSDPNIKQK